MKNRDSGRGASLSLTRVAVAGLQRARKPVSAWTSNRPPDLFFENRRLCRRRGWACWIDKPLSNKKCISKLNAAPSRDTQTLYTCYHTYTLQPLQTPNPQSSPHLLPPILPFPLSLNLMNHHINPHPKPPPPPHNSHPPHNRPRPDRKR